MVQRRNRSHEHMTATRMGKGNGVTDAGGRRNTNPGGRPSLEFDWDTVIPRIDKMLEERRRNA